MGRLIFATIATWAVVIAFMAFQAPRLITDLRHSKEFVPALGMKITSYKCTNWNAVMFNECTVTYQPAPNAATQSFTDWRFGSAPQESIRLVRLRDDPRAVTTDLSLRTLGNRLMLAISVLALGVLASFAAVRKGKKILDTPDAAPPLDRQPTVT